MEAFTSSFDLPSEAKCSGPHVRMFRGGKSRATSAATLTNVRPFTSLARPKVSGASAPAGVPVVDMALMAAGFHGPYWYLRVSVAC